MTDVVVQVLWDEDAAIWVAISRDIPGLAIEEQNIDRLQKKILSAVQDLAELNRPDALADGLAVHCKIEKTLHLKTRSTMG